MGYASARRRAPGRDSKAEDSKEMNEDEAMRLRQAWSAALFTPSHQATDLSPRCSCSANLTGMHAAA